MYFLEKLVALSLAAGSATAAAVPASPAPKGLKYWYTFGQSTCATGFDSNATQPSVGNPMGNPDPPQSFSGGLTYVNYVTTQYNSSLVYNYNFARTGATVSRSVMDPGKNFSTGLDEQAHYRWANRYAAPNRTWTAETGFVNFHFGINDVRFILTRVNSPNETDWMQRIFDSYFQTVEFVYSQGIRKMMFVTLEDVSRTPWYAPNTTLVPTMHKWSVDFNTNLKQRVANFTHSHPDVVTSVFDNYVLSNYVLDHPQQFGFPNNTCQDLSGKTCYWYDNLHPSEKYHSIMAPRLVKAMNSLGYDGSVPVGGYFS